MDEIKSHQNPLFRTEAGSSGVSLFAVPCWCVRYGVSGATKPDGSSGLTV